MHGRKFEMEKIYPTYKPCPFSLDSPVNVYSSETPPADKNPGFKIFLPDASFLIQP